MDIRARLHGLADEGVGRGLLIGTAGTLLLNVGTLGLNFVLTVVLTRTLGATGYGAYAFALAWAMVLSVPATLGLAALVVRSVAGYTANNQLSLLRGFLRRANQLAGMSSALVVVGAAAAGWFALEHSEGLLEPFLVGLLLVPIFAFNTVRQSALQGLGRVVVARVPETLIVPLVSIALVGGANVILDAGLTPAWAIGLGVAAAALALAIGALLLHQALPVGTRAVPPSYQMHLWGPSVIRLLFASLLTALSGQLGVILLGLLGDSTDAGIFSVAQRVALFASFLALAASYPLMPAVARLHASGRPDELQRTLTRAARLALLGSMPLVVLLLGLGGQIMNLFGGDFSDGVRAMQILVLGELSSLLFGYGGLALIMTGKEREFTFAVGFRVACAFVLMMALVPAFGITGAAIGATIAAIASNLVIALLVWRRLRIFTPAIPWLHRERLP